LRARFFIQSFSSASESPAALKARWSFEANRPKSCAKNVQDFFRKKIRLLGRGAPEAKYFGEKGGKTGPEVRIHGKPTKDLWQTDRVRLEPTKTGWVLWITFRFAPE
jgi:hypothetical protein